MSLVDLNGVASLLVENESILRLISSDNGLDIASDSKETYSLMEDDILSRHGYIELREDKHPQQ